MIKINKYIFGFLGLLILVAGIFVGIVLVNQNQDIREKAAPATVAYISPATQENQIGRNFVFFVKMDATNNLITGADVRLNFDASKFEIVSLEKGSGATNLEATLTSTSDNTNGKIQYVIYTLDKTKALSGNNIEILKVNAKSKSNAPVGSFAISFDTETAASGVGETQNILTAKTNGSVNIVAVVDPTDPPIGGNNEGEPNSCGGTCGSNNNCKANLYCYQGFCRNPSCSTKTDCNCSAAATTKATTKPNTTGGTVYKTATAKATSSSKSSSKPSATYSSGISRELLQTIEPSAAESDPLDQGEPKPENEFFAKYALYFVAGFILIAIVATIFALKKKKEESIPHILPPTNI